MANRDEDILEELKNISFLMGDLNAIRNGEYDPPKGADPSGKRTVATPDDLFNRLGTIIGLLERQNEMLYQIGRNTAPSPEAWDDQASDD